MDNDPRAGPFVKWLERNNSPNYIAKTTRLEKLPLVEMSLRIDGYLRGCFARGARYIIWDKHRFHRATKSGKARKVSHIEQAMTAFRKASTNWQFEDIWYRAPGQPRTHRRIKITIAGRGEAPSQMQTTIRFLAYVTSAVRLNGIVKVDRIFLEKFWETSELPPHWIRIAWQRMRKIRGYRVKWRGVGAGRKAVVSLPYFSTRSSSPTGRRFKTVVPAAPEFLQGRSTAPGGAPRSFSNQIAAPVGAAGGDPPSPLPPSPGTGNPPAPDPTASRPPFGAAVRGSGRRSASGKLPPPLFVSGRWISSQKTMAKACWVAVNRMRPEHTGQRVAWRFAHARNLAFMALRQGHSETAIVAAWRTAVRRSHEDACDEDLRRRPSTDYAHPLREPSAAVAYAWKILRADTRTPEARWSEIYASVRPTRDPRPAQKPQGLEAPHKSGPGCASEAGDLSGVWEGKRLEQRTIEAALKSLGLKLQDLVKMSRSGQAAFVKATFEAQKKGN